MILSLGMNLTLPPLFDGDRFPKLLSLCEHIAGNEKFIAKALLLQSHYIANDSKKSLVDITVDLEDGASVGSEKQQLDLAIETVKSASNKFGQIGVRVHDPGHKLFEHELQALIKASGNSLAYLTIPKVRDRNELSKVVALLDRISQSSGLANKIPLHIIVETIGALRDIWSIAGHSQVEVLDFGIMDWVSEFNGTIPDSSMRSPGQFEHPIVANAKIEISKAAHVFGKIPSHNVTVDVRAKGQARADAERACKDFGFMRMWSIHPDQIPEILAGFEPEKSEIDLADIILKKAEDAQWGPIEHEGRLHDRASYRHYWCVKQRAERSRRRL